MSGQKPPAPPALSSADVNRRVQIGAEHYLPVIAPYNGLDANSVHKVTDRLRWRGHN